ncbi:PUA domain-containing protein [Fervidicoccus fontis]|uniref:PUA domain-containing protein n=1 Tax=Fervidicoccus fontis TaxID=683846 RepID=A0A2J6N2Q0_9CREN|nr:PUA domain-containing protein [Fervidicoccus fontis]PMB75589.1 MAG: hypothetical protein C0188_02395 [Fervidicoccus fontis]HEW64085.1 hypothetical protein [Fervidicoccus fontis]
MQIKREKPSKFELIQLKSVIAYQFGKEAVESIFKSNNSIEVSRYSTGRIRTVYINGEEALYFNPKIGLFSLSMYGASLIFPSIPKETKRIAVITEVFENYTKKTLLAPAVAWSTNDIRDGDEVFIVNENGELLALGKALLCHEEIKKIKRGKVALIKRKR